MRDRTHRPPQKKKLVHAVWHMSCAQIVRHASRRMLYGDTRRTGQVELPEEVVRVALVLVVVPHHEGETGALVARCPWELERLRVGGKVPRHICRMPRAAA